MAPDLLLRLRKLLNAFRSRPLLRALMLGTGAAVEHAPVLDWTGAATIIDVGANRGQFALMASERRPGARILAFEPLAGPAVAFARLFAGNPRVSLHEVALGAERGHLPMTITEQDDSSSLLPVGQLQAELFASRPTASTIVPVRSLDEVLAGEDLAAPVLLKVDVQGYELHVLRGAIASLRHVDFVYVELSFLPLYTSQPLAHDVIAFLSQQGFALRGVFNQGWSPRHGAIQADFLFASGAKPGPGKPSEDAAREIADG
jgi:FkbM family methyltransferase